ncbi:aspartyl/asparaginyl beta-hydroxylase domain-containing protein [Stigmatella aurantiaca]|uniref:Aspartyl/Asparaginyl beta-hydroxylase family n=1 Tax=Stigmatella aurantiaca (strain DW4/3-1) TaxID=378806 RepID=E3FH17_STIAD|nr:aspartyl/asparaginyl beta-hydroxylase domain-containing protein [Stigmatella aurantiaca]ADO74047.1 Aspartyl/Asparaginyl beta-hydroxylase family [Stigmatella aurantiaca DW4/3-1]
MNVRFSRPVIASSRVPLNVDADALEAELRFLQEDASAMMWIDHVNRQDYRGGWDVLPLRCLREHLHAHPVLQGFAIGQGGDWVDLPVLSGCAALSSVLAQLQCPLKSARLMRLRAGSEIKPHRDLRLGMEHGEARLHLPLQWSDGVEFLVEKQRVPMKKGELWYINADLIHEVYNRGNTDRINLVIDCVVNDWLREQIAGEHGR